ncbi:MAG TPA: sorbosone dehydrogenase family protein [Steroidobacteraceae bacterium]|nr:sorbosone dehydrogenase family protein [Steroidobacteraceae bacterium]
MSRWTDATTVILPIFILLAGCAGTRSDLPIDASSGQNLSLPQPDKKAIPTVNVAPAKGWSGDQKPSAAAGFAVTSYAADLDHPRWLYVLPNGDVLVAETNAPADRPDDKKGVKGFFMKKAQAKAGAGVPSPNRITLLRDADGDGKAEVRSVFLRGLNSPFGMALVGNNFYVANTDAVMRFDYRAGVQSINGPGTKVADLPAGSINHHWTKNLIASPDGEHLYVTVGSNSNIAENGMENEERRAAILEIDTASGSSRVFATGLRNPNGMDWQPQSGALWTVVNERDELGNDLVPDYLTSVKDGGFYGWPYSYFGRNVDERPQPPRPDLVAKAIVPDYALGAHTASLGLVFYRSAIAAAHSSGNTAPGIASRSPGTG